MAGLNKFDEKLKREMRRRNHEERDLHKRRKPVPRKCVEDSNYTYLEDDEEIA